MAAVSAFVTTRRQDITDTVIRILEEMTSEWETDLPGPISPETLLVAEMCCTSIDIVQLAIAIEEQFGVRGLPFSNS